MKIFALSAVLIFLQIAGTGKVFADDQIYKSIGPNGEVTYSMKPAADAARVETIQVQTLSREQQRAVKSYMQREAAAGQQANAYAASLESKWKQVDREITAAETALQKADAALQNGRIPLPGERRGMVDGYSRFTQHYFDRIAKLEAAATVAKQRLDNAYQARNELK